MKKPKEIYNNNYCPRCCDFMFFVISSNRGFWGKLCNKCKKKEKEYKLFLKSKSNKKNISRLITTCAVRNGLIDKKTCEVCGEIKVEGHHEDYTKPLEIIWLCKEHHLERHKELKKQGIIIKF